MKSRLCIEDDPSTAQLLKRFAPVPIQKTAFSGAVVFVEYKSLSQLKNYSLKTDLNASKLFVHQSNQGGKLSKRLGGNISRCELLVLYRIMYGNRAMKVQRRANFVVGSNNTETLG